MRHMRVQNIVLRVQCK